MPVLETYSARLQSRGSQLTPTRASVSDFNQTGEALGEAAVAMDKISQHVTKIQTQEQKLELGKKLSEFQLAWITESEKLKQEHGDKPEYGQIVQARADEMLGSIQPGVHVKNEFDATLADFKVSLQKDVMATQIRVAGERQKAAFTETVTNLENAVRLDARQFDLAEKNLASTTATLPVEIRDGLLSEAKSRLLFARAEGVADKSPGKFLADYKAGKYNDVSNVDRIANFAESKIKSLEAEKNKGDAVLASNLELAIKTTSDPQELVSLAKKVDEVEGSIGTVRANDLRYRIFTESKAINEKYELTSLGSAFATGEYSVDIKNETDVKAANAYFGAREKELESVDVYQANAERSDFIKKAKFVPDAIFGKMENWSRSTRKEDITKAADLYNRVAAENPQMLDKLASADSLKRISLVDDRIQRGIPVADALKQVDQIMVPRSKTEREVLSENLKTLKANKDVDYKEEALGAFNSVFNRLPFTEDNVEEDSLSVNSIQAAYATAFESHYTQTGDLQGAKKYAKEMVAGSFSRSSINGKTEVMRYAPELYFKEYDNVKLRDVVVTAGVDAAQGTLGTIDKDRVRLIPDPYYTQRAVKVGQPAYKLVYLNEYGIPVDMLKPNQLITFDQKDLGKLELEKQKAPSGGLENMFKVRGSSKTDYPMSKRGYKIITTDQLGG